MKRMLSLLLAVAVLFAFSLGCAEVSKGVAKETPKKGVSKETSKEEAKPEELPPP